MQLGRSCGIVHMRGLRLKPSVSLSINYPHSMTRVGDCLVSAPRAVAPQCLTADAISAVLQAIEHGHVPTGMYVVTALLLGGAFFPPAPRVAAFATGIVTIVVLFGKEVLDAYTAAAPVVGNVSVSTNALKMGDKLPVSNYVFHGRYEQACCSVGFVVQSSD